MNLYQKSFVHTKSKISNAGYSNWTYTVHSLTDSYPAYAVIINHQLKNKNIHSNPCMEIELQQNQHC